MTALWNRQGWLLSRNFLGQGPPAKYGWQYVQSTQLFCCYMSLYTCSIYLFCCYMSLYTCSDGGGHASSEWIWCHCLKHRYSSFSFSGKLLQGSVTEKSTTCTIGKWCLISTLQQLLQHKMFHPQNGIMHTCKMKGNMRGNCTHAQWQIVLGSSLKEGSSCEVSQLHSSQNFATVHNGITSKHLC